MKKSLERQADILAMRIQGKNFVQIGNAFKISPERARQIIIRGRMRAQEACIDANKEAFVDWINERIEALVLAGKYSTKASARQVMNSARLMKLEMGPMLEKFECVRIP